MCVYLYIIWGASDFDSEGTWQSESAIAYIVCMASARAREAEIDRAGQLEGARNNCGVGVYMRASEHWHASMHAHRQADGQTVVRRCTA